jgi:predicted flap endonuclease-1-like 5' DNA nuclease
MPEELPASKLDLLGTIDPHKPIIDMPDTKLDTDLEMQTMHIEQQDIDPLLVAIDPHKPIIDPPDMELEAEVETSSIQLEPLDIEPLRNIGPLDIDPLLLAIDPHKPIVDPPDMAVEAPAMQIETLDTDPLLAAIDPHKLIIDPPDMPEASANNGTTGNLFNDWLHKAKDSVEHLTEKATPTASEWLHKAKDSVEHLTEKASPTSNEWLNKAKEFGSGLTSKGNSLGSETLVKSSSALAALAASAKELTEKLASNLSIKHDDLQKLVGIGPTFASVLHRAGIHTYQQLADTSPQKLQALLIVEDEQFSQHDTSSWPTQAALAAQGEWEKLQAYQNSL